MYIEKLKELRVDRDVTQKELASYLKISTNTYCQYENDVRHFPIECIIELARFYKVSTDYILGLTDIMKPYPRIRAENKIKYQSLLKPTRSATSETS